MAAMRAPDAAAAGCLFCRVVGALERADECPHPESAEPVRKIQDLPASVAILGADQFYRGYALVVARTHATELYRLPEAEAIQYFRDMLRVARAIDRAFQPRKLNYELLGNTVPHLHWHLFPRYADDPDPLRPVWEHAHPPRAASSEEAAATIAAIRRQL
ncbi:MAG: HIT family protein [Candidatus Rokubacteria bacterium]|nr:HIT family protein [Candidatus Rokubacteria bacterium]